MDFTDTTCSRDDLIVLLRNAFAVLRDEILSGRSEPALGEIDVPRRDIKEAALKIHNSGRLEPLIRALCSFPAIRSHAALPTDDAEMAAKRAYHASAPMKLVGFLMYVCDSKGRLDEAAFERAFKDLWQLAIGGAPGWSVVVVLKGLKVRGSVMLGDAELRCLAYEEREEFLDHVESTESMSDRAFAETCESCIVFTNASVVTPQIDRKELVQRAFILTRALRIWCGNDIGIAYIMHQSYCFGPKWAHPGRLGIFPSQELEQLGEFKNFWQSVGKVLAQPPPGLDIALARYDLMHDHPRASDRLLDQSIILEALFLAEGRGELSYRLKLRVAHFIGDTYEERLRVADCMKKVYDLRSKVVHGAGPVSDKDKDTQEWLDSAVRKILRRYCEKAAATGSNKHIQKTVCEELDRYLLERREDV